MTQSAQETRVIDPKTGGAKGQKIFRFDLIPYDALEEVARVYGEGAKKYADDNWMKGYRWRLSAGALARHFAKFMLGEERDPETGCLHLACVAWHALTLITFYLRGLGTDDRAKRTLILPAEAAPAPVDVHTKIEPLKKPEELPDHPGFEGDRRPVGWFRSVNRYCCLNGGPEACGRPIPEGERVYATGEPGGILCEACAKKRAPLSPPDFDPPRCGAV